MFDFVKRGWQQELAMDPSIPYVQEKTFAIQNKIAVNCVIELQVFDEAFKHGIGGYIVDWDSDFEISVTVQIGYQFKRYDLNDLNSEIKSVIRHELEHAGQLMRQDHIELIPDGKGYYDSEHEKSAHVVGLKKQAKFKKIPFGDTLRDFFGTNRSAALNFNSREDLNDTVRKYAEYEKGRFPNKNKKAMATKPTQKPITIKKPNPVQKYKKVAINENGIKALVGKDDDDELTIDDAKKIGQKISKMKGQERKKYAGIVNFMGASCRVFNEIWSHYKPVNTKRTVKNDAKVYRGNKKKKDSE